MVGLISFIMSTLLVFLIIILAQMESIMMVIPALTLIGWVSFTTWLIEF